MKKLTALVLLLVLTPLAALPASAGVDRWTPFGRGDDSALDLLLTPTGLHAVTADGRVFRSTDRGETWQYWGVGLDPGIRRIAADPADPRVMAAVGTFGDVYLSTDAGRFWSRLPHRVDEEVDPVVASLRIAAGTIYVGGRYLYVSRDDGETWSPASLGYIPSITVDPTDPRTVWFATTGGLWKTTDAGETFTLTLNPPYEIGNYGVTAVAVAPSRPATVYAGANRRLYASQDGGATWQEGPQIGPGIGIGDLSSLIVDPADPAKVYATGPGGIALSRDGGATWTVLASPATSTLILTPDTLFAGTSGDGLYVSVDGGRSWARRDRVGMGYPVTTFIERDPRRPQVLYLFHGTSGFGLLRSTDGGRTWAPFTNLSTFQNSLVDLAFDDRRPGVLYTVSQSNGAAYRIERDGTAKRMPVPTQREMYTVATSGPAVLVGNSWAGYRSEDGGETWKDVLPRIVSKGAGGEVDRIVLQFVEDPLDTATVYAFTLENGPGVNRYVVLRSDDTGLHWRQVRTGDLHAFAVDPRDEGTLYSAETAGDQTALFRSRDGGNRWRRIGTIPQFPGGRVISLVVDTKHQDRLWVTNELGVLRSDDGGRTWTPFNAGLSRPGLTGAPIKLTPDPVVPGRLYALPSAGGAFDITVD